MSDDTFSASDFSSAETSLSSEPAAASAAPAESSAPVDAAAQPGEATTQPAAVATEPPITEPDDNTPGPRLKDHQRILENARQKAIAEWEQQYGWAKQVDRGELEQAITLARTLSANPVEGLQQLIAEVQKDPQHAAQLRSLAARALAQGRQAAPQADQEPQLEMVAIQLEDGRVVKFPTADSIAAREAWVQRKAVEQATAQFQPFVQTLQTLQERENALVQERQVEHFKETTYSDVKTWPGMETKEAEIALAKELANARINPFNPHEVLIALNAAYRKAILPNLHTASRQAVVNDINRQAAASTVNPAQTSTRAPKSMDDMSIAEALQHVATQTT